MSTELEIHAQKKFLRKYGFFEKQPLYINTGSSSMIHSLPSQIHGNSAALRFQKVYTPTCTVFGISVIFIIGGKCLFQQEPT